MSHPQMNVAVVLGTRPEIIKMAPVIREFSRRLGAGGVAVYDTGQHDDASMSGRFHAEHGLREPAVRLDGGGMARSATIGYLVTRLGDELARRKPDAVIVLGDTSSTVAGALAANAVGTPLVHVEAGLRSFDRTMPEEHNRVLTDHLADLCCAATWANVENLTAERVDPTRIVRTGSTVVEAVGSRLPAKRVQTETRTNLGVADGRYILATLHRPENTDDPTVLGTILSDLARVGRAFHRDVVLQLHHRTRRAIEDAGESRLLGKFHVVDPMGSADFLSLVAGASVVVSDSGGVAEEVTILKRPLVIVRRTTERVESIDAGFAALAGPHEVFAAAGDVLSDPGVTARLAATPSPYGDGTAAKQIVAHTVSRYSRGSVPGVYRLASRGGLTTPEGRP